MNVASIPFTLFSVIFSQVLPPVQARQGGGCERRGTVEGKQEESKDEVFFVRMQA